MTVDLMLCDKESVTPDVAAQMTMQGGWLVQRKYDGLRACIVGGKLYDRQGKEITERFPEFEGLKSIPVALDGEIVAQSGEFNDISGRVHLRDKLAIRLLSRKSPARFVAFDLPLLALSNEERLRHLPQVVGALRCSWIEASPLLNDVNIAWSIVKRCASRYAGGRSKDWVKVKYFVETEALFTKCDDHPRGVRLETADGRSVNVNGAQAVEVRRRFDKEGVVRCEVRYMPIRGSEAWRFPSFRGVC
jgi:hypothetical protein